MQYYIKEENWKQILEFIKSVKGMHSKDEKRLRIFIEAVWYIVRSGCQWRLLPKTYGNYRSIHKRFKRWCERDVWKKLLEYTRLCGQNFREAIQELQQN
ncbi:transposase [Wolbachia endosymbiont (group A) of Volucella inflata]|uniref:transposase n=1 Tax=Wolbachia endosymbiont (group A) of Volucella inflata TaxID=2954065 RepID=UPI00222707A5|nr:transposase [Wolbachia endosymbiont (group A) of Volucella inflata]